MASLKSCKEKRKTKPFQLRILYSMKKIFKNEGKGWPSGSVG